MASRAEFEQLLGVTVAPLGLVLGPSEVEALFAHYELLLHWNRRINLTSVRGARDIVERHFGESLFLAARMPEEGRVVDIGSGAGFPGLPVAVVKRGLKVTLVESVGKKAAFLRECAREHGSVRVCGCRLKEVSGKFDWATWRGVALEGIEDEVGGMVARAAAITSEKLATEWANSKVIAWEAPIPLPWDQRRVLLMGSVR